jgi:hypothetical protein
VTALPQFGVVEASSRGPYVATAYSAEGGAPTTSDMRWFCKRISSSACRWVGMPQRIYVSAFGLCIFVPTCPTVPRLSAPCSSGPPCFRVPFDSQSPYHPRNSWLTATLAHVFHLGIQGFRRLSPLSECSVRPAGRTKKSPSGEGLPRPATLLTEARTLVVTSTRQVLRRDAGRSSRTRRRRPSRESSASGDGLRAANPNDVLVGVEVWPYGQEFAGD